MTGQIFNIQKYALHDGPGIRTTVFFKGCPLSCKWCHNPESIRSEQELTFNKAKCINCNTCSDFTDPDPCPSEALKHVSKTYTVERLLEEILKDHIFYEQSKGGVTFSGGEPLMQGDFLLEILRACKSKDIHTTVDTSGFADWSIIDKIRPFVDLFLYDIKHTDDQVHQSLTGVSNQLILDNFKKLVEHNDLYLRLILLKGINDNERHYNEILKMINPDHVIQINLLPYHNYAENKHSQLKNDTVFTAYQRPDDADLAHAKAFFEKHGIKVVIGG